MKTHLCFFCMKAETRTGFTCGPDFEWPWPIDKGTMFACCDECSRLSADQKADHIMRYAQAIMIGTN